MTTVNDPTALEAELLNVAVEAARAAGAELLARWRRPLKIGTKSTPTDPVTEADVNAERAIRDVLGRRRPSDSILGEEGGETAGAPAPTPTSLKDNENDSHSHDTENGSPRLRWVVDPLDGTVNYLYGLPTFAVSVAVEDSEGALAGVVLDPVRDELFSATRSGVPVCSGEPITASTCDTLAQALVGTGFAYEPAVRAIQGNVVTRVLPLTRDIRRAGAAALDMCSCASGRLDAYYERDVKAWDIGAGTLICERAGLVVRTLEATDTLPSGVVVATPQLINELEALVVGA
ncbi:MAG TPA: inositol monophosphatase family protein [Solirubrobacteraceae bacterium]|nr:inositol monophosphatase family protein [Solirubrobacteraceae bacterium]